MNKQISHRELKISQLLLQMPVYYKSARNKGQQHKAESHDISTRSTIKPNVQQDIQVPCHPLHPATAYDPPQTVPET